MPPAVLGLCLQTLIRIGWSFGAETKFHALFGGVQPRALAAAGAAANKQASRPVHKTTALPKRFMSARDKTVTTAPSLRRVLGHPVAARSAPKRLVIIARPDGEATHFARPVKPLHWLILIPG